MFDWIWLNIARKLTQNVVYLQVANMCEHDCVLFRVKINKADDKTRKESVTSDSIGFP